MTYRIRTNGQRFRIEYRYRWLPIWLGLGYYTQATRRVKNVWPASLGYPSREAAERALQHYLAWEHPWVVVCG